MWQTLAMLEIVLLLLPLFGIIAAGYGAGIIKLADQRWITILNLFGFYVAFPALIFKSLATSPISFSLHGSIMIIQFLFAVIIMLGTWGVCHILKLTKELRNTFSIGVYFSLSGYIGIPALQLVLGDAAAEGTVIVGVMIFVTLTLGISLLESSRQRHIQAKKILVSILRNPLIWATAVGVGLGLTGWTLPTTVERFITLMANAAAPTVLVALGIFLAYNHPQRATLKIAGLLAGIKMIAIPLLWWLGLWFIPNSDWLNTTFIQASMPVALTTFAFAEIYPMHKPVVSTAIVLSTLAGFIVIPLSIWLTQQ